MKMEWDNLALAQCLALRKCSLSRCLINALVLHLLHTGEHLGEVQMAVT